MMTITGKFRFRITEREKKKKFCKVLVAAYNYTIEWGRAGAIHEKAGGGSRIKIMDGGRVGA